MLLKRPIIQAYMLASKWMTEQSPCKIFNGSEDEQKPPRQGRVYTLATVSRRIKHKIHVVVGYSEKSTTATLCNFVESIINTQWEIAVLVVRSCEQIPKLTLDILTVKVLEVDDRHPLTIFIRPKCTGSQKDSSKGTPATSSHTKGGKTKRNASELKEDALLWVKLKEGTQITWNEYFNTLIF